MNFTFRPAKRENTPLIIGLAGPSKSGKTYSAHRLARGLAGDAGKVLMLNAEGPRGHQYADKFQYVGCDLVPPFRPTMYTEALEAAAAEKPAVIIIDSVSHMHDGPGGLLEWHDEELTRMAGADQGKRDRCNMAAWIKPKAGENQFIYQMLAMRVPVILCMRAKEKIRVVPGKPPVDLGWQPIVGDRVSFETIFTLTLPPQSKGVPDLSISDLREPFDRMIPNGKEIDEELGKRLAAWSAGAAATAQPPVEAQPSASAASKTAGAVPAAPVITKDEVDELGRWLVEFKLDAKRLGKLIENTCGVKVVSAAKLTRQAFSQMKRQFERLRAGDINLDPKELRFVEPPAEPGADVEETAAAAVAPLGEDPDNIKRGDIPF